MEIKEDTLEWERRLIAMCIKVIISKMKRVEHIKYHLLDRVSLSLSLCRLLECRRRRGFIGWVLKWSNCGKEKEEKERDRGKQFWFHFHELQIYTFTFSLLYTFNIIWKGDVESQFIVIREEREDNRECKVSCNQFLDIHSSNWVYCCWEAILNSTIRISFSFLQMSSSSPLFNSFHSKSLPLHSLRRSTYSVSSSWCRLSFYFSLFLSM